MDDMCVYVYMVLLIRTYLARSHLREQELFFISLYVDECLGKAIRHSNGLLTYVDLQEGNESI